MRERLRSRTLSAPLGRPKKGLESNSREKPFVISSDSDSDEDSLLENERSSNGSELVECGEDGGAVGPGRRSGKRPSRGDDNERVGGEKKKEKVQPLHGEIEINCRVLPSTSAAMSKTEKNRGSNLSDGKRVEMEKDERDGLVGGQLSKCKGKRGRPAKPKAMLKGKKVVVGFKKGKRGLKLTDNVKRKGLNNNLCLEKEAMGKEKDLKRDKKKKFAVSETEYNESRPERVNALRLEKKRLKKEEKTEGKKTETQILREQIVGILLSAGWTIEHRPRIGRVYSDAVYLSPQGRSYWSITLAYSAFKSQFEGGDGDCFDSKISPLFSPVSEEVLSKLTRKRKERKERKVKSMQKGEGGGKIDNVVTEMKSAKKKKRGAEIIKGSSFKHREKLNSVARAVEKSSSKGRVKKCLLTEQDNSNCDGNKSQETRNRKRGALLVRTSMEGVNMDIDGTIPCSGKRTVLNWMIDLGTVPLNGKVQYMDRGRTLVVLEGRITRDGIHCGCCGEIFTISKFETHAGSKLCQPYQNIFLENGSSILQCLLDSWNKQEESVREGFHLVDVDGDDPSDDTCGFCGDGGDLICCDSCPSTFHQSCLDIQIFPSGEWHCVYCLCKFCGSTYQRGDNHGTTSLALLTCRLCEEMYHQSCAQAKGAAINDDSGIPSFCGKKCQELFEGIQMLLGVKHELEDGFSWTLIQRSEVSSDISLSGMPRKVECNSKLAVAWSVMDECFLPIVDHRSGINFIHNVLYNCGSNFIRLNFSGFFTAILERGDEIVSAASIRIRGNQLAEMPFIGTPHIYWHQGMCRRLLGAIETALCSLHVEKLVVPVISDSVQTWISAFGFEPLEASIKQEMRNMKMLVFPGIDILQKTLLKQQFAEENVVATADLKSTKVIEEHQTAHELANNSDRRAGH